MMMANDSTEWEQYRYAQARAWLEHVRDLGERVQSMRALVDAEYAAIDGVRAIDPSREGHGGSGSTDDAMLEAIERITKHVREYAALLSEYEDERYDARRHLASMPEHSERAALTYRYLLGWTWESICVELHYSYDGMMKLRRRAIVNAYDVLPNGWRDRIPRAY